MADWSIFHIANRKFTGGQRRSQAEVLPDGRCSALFVAVVTVSTDTTAIAVASAVIATTRATTPITSAIRTIGVRVLTCRTLLVFDVTADPANGHHEVMNDLHNRAGGGGKTLLCIRRYRRNGVPGAMREVRPANTEPQVSIAVKAAAASGAAMLSSTSSWDRRATRSALEWIHGEFVFSSCRKRQPSAYSFAPAVATSGLVWRRGRRRPMSRRWYFDAVHGLSSRISRFFPAAAFGWPCWACQRGEGHCVAPWRR